MEGKIKIGPAGKSVGSTTIGNWDTGSHNNIISQIFLSHNAKGIMSIQFQFMLDDKFILSDLSGHHHTGTKFDAIALNYPHEYITGISGEYTPFSRGSGYPNVLTLKFTTNSNEYGPFGPSSAPCSKEKFEFNLGKFRQFGGFYGTSDASGLQCIGVYLQPITIN